VVNIGTVGPSFLTGVDQLCAQQYSTMHNAAAEGTLPAVKHFLDGRATVKRDVKDYDIAGKCAIHYAAEHGHNHIITFLLGRLVVLLRYTRSFTFGLIQEVSG
jgi:hypothetical protein